MHEVLFPYALSHLEEHLTRHYHEEQTREDVRALIRLSRQDQQEGVSASSPAVLCCAVLWLERCRVQY